MHYKGKRNLAIPHLGIMGSTLAYFCVTWLSRGSVSLALSQVPLDEAQQLTVETVGDSDRRQRSFVVEKSFGQPDA